MSYRLILGDKSINLRRDRWQLYAINDRAYKFQKIDCTKSDVNPMVRIECLKTTLAGVAVDPENESDSR